MLTSDDLQAYLQQHAVAATILRLADETPTVPAAAAALGVSAAQIVKSVLFLVDERPWLVVAAGTARVSRRKLATHLGVGRKRPKLATADQVLAWTGYPAGTVPPFGHATPLPTLIDSGVTTHALLYAGGGAHNGMMRIACDELLRVLDAPLVGLVEDAPT